MKYDKGNNLYIAVSISMLLIYKNLTIYNMSHVRWNIRRLEKKDNRNLLKIWLRRLLTALYRFEIFSVLQCCHLHRKVATTLVFSLHYWLLIIIPICSSLRDINQFPYIWWKQSSIWILIAAVFAWIKVEALAVVYQCLGYEFHKKKFLLWCIGW